MIEISSLSQTAALQAAGKFPKQIASVLRSSGQCAIPNGNGSRLAAILRPKKVHQV